MAESQVVSSDFAVPLNSDTDRDSENFNVALETLFTKELGRFIH